MSGISHERFLSLGATVMPMRIESIKELVGVEVDECYGTYTIFNTPNSSDLCFARIGDRGYIDIRSNPRWVHQFHPDEWPVIEEKLEESPFVDPFGISVRTIVSEKTWEHHYKCRYERQG